MRVITGLYKGRILKTVRDLRVRPATDRVKQTIFDMLSTRIELDGIQVLDLFAGSGGLGIEALSRGAGRVTFVESDREAAAFIEQNIESLGCEDRATIEEMDAMFFTSRVRSSFDLIFADPPYDFEQTAEIPNMVFAQNLLKPNGYLLMEHAPHLHFDATPFYLAGPEKKFGRTLVTFFQTRKNANGSPRTSQPSSVERP